MVFKIIGAALGGVLLIFAIAANSTTSNIVSEFKSSGIQRKSESGIWLNRDLEPKEEDAKPTYCNQDEAGNCFAQDGSDCCKSLKSRCEASKTFGVFSGVLAAASLAGVVMAPIGMLAAILNAICNLVLFSITAQNLNGEFRENGATNNNADCGFKGLFDNNPSVSDGSITGGAAFGLNIVSFFLAVGQAVVFLLAFKSASAA